MTKRLFQVSATLTDVSQANNQQKNNADAETYSIQPVTLVNSYLCYIAN